MWTDPQIRFAVDVVRDVSVLARRIRAEMVTPALAKQDRSPVTVADFTVQAIVARRLEDAFPNEILVGEESSRDLASPAAVQTLARVTGFVKLSFPDANEDRVCRWIDRGTAEPGRAFWTVDPIDGTKGFLRGDQYAIALARIEDGKVRLGVLGCPAMSSSGRPADDADGFLVAAAGGQGAWGSALADGPWRRLQTSAQSDSSRATLLRSVESSHTNPAEVDALGERLGVRVPPLPMDSQAKYATLAAGQAELLVRLLSPDRPRYYEKIWDHAAGSLVVEEAGGRVSDLDGKPLDFSLGRMLAGNRGLLATNGPLHEQALAALAKLDR